MSKTIIANINAKKIMMKPKKNNRMIESLNPPIFPEMADRISAKVDTSAPDCFRSLSRSPGRGSPKKLFAPFNLAQHRKRLLKRVIERREQDALSAVQKVSLSPPPMRVPSPLIVPAKKKKKSQAVRKSYELGKSAAQRTENNECTMSRKET